MAFEEVCERTRSATIGIVTEGDEEQPFYVASGVLVRLGGVEFALTAAHNVWDAKRDPGREVIAFAMMQVPAGIALLSTLGRTAGPVHVHRVEQGEAPEPDVAVVELLDTTYLLPGRKPFEEHEIRFCAHDQPPGPFVLCGFPRGRATLLPDLVIDGVTRRQLDLTRIPLVVRSLPRERFRQEPPSGRGLHVFLDPGFPSSEGMSGGPLVLPDKDGMLVGLARGRAPHGDGYDEWCEPVVEAVRPLTEHRNPEVAAAARRIVARCDARPTTAG